jgi:hypothetical protein
VLKGLGLPSTLYLLKRCISGVQALTSKYSTLDLHQLFHGLNERGECKTWISANFLEFKPSASSLPSRQQSILHLLGTVKDLADAPSQLLLQSFFY